jgi:hypothetical protein
MTMAELEKLERKSKRDAIAEYTRALAEELGRALTWDERAEAVAEAEEIMREVTCEVYQRGFDEHYPELLEKVWELALNGDREIVAGACRLLRRFQEKGYDIR